MWIFVGSLPFPRNSADLSGNIISGKNLDVPILSPTDEGNKCTRCTGFIDGPVDNPPNPQTFHFLLKTGIFSRYKEFFQGEYKTHLQARGMGRLASETLKGDSMIALRQCCWAGKWE